MPAEREARGACAAPHARGAASRLRIGGFVPFTATDFPGALAAVVFCQGCAWRCGYCHNPHLLPVRGDHGIEWATVTQFLETRRGLLDAVVFSGGEPTLQHALFDAMQAVKDLGFKVGLHTAGIYPKRLARVLALVDWVGYDMKAAFDDYEAITRTPHSGARARRSLELVLASGVAHQFRTTLDTRMLSPARLGALRAELERYGIARHVLQPCRETGPAAPLVP